MDNYSKLFVTYDLAVLLKKNGFNAECLAFYDEGSDNLFLSGYSNNSKTTIDYTAYNNTIKAPLYDQVLRWLRNEHKLLVDISFNGSETFYAIVRKYEPFGEDLFTSYTESVDGWPTYEEALPMAIYEALKFVK